MSEVKFKACDLRANAIVVQEHDFDRVTAERDAALGREAALREERNDLSLQTERLKADNKNYDLLLSRSGIQRDALQQRLTAADERADVLEGLLREVEAACDLAMSAIDHDERGANFVRIIAAIKAKAVPKRSDELVAQHAAIDFFDAALKPAEAAKCCTVSPEDRALLDAGDYTPEELWGAGGKPSCPKCAKP